MKAFLTVFSGPYALLARFVALGIACLALFSYGWFKGNDHGTQKLYDFVGKQLVETTRIGAIRERITREVVDHYIETAGISTTVEKVIQQEVIKYVEKNPTGTCLDPEWRRVHDDAARGVPVPAPRLRLDGDLRTTRAVTGERSDGG